ncbi:DUF2163 domain-containing protein [Sphingomonas jatrophae]|uniref:Bacteriophage phiJL001 Gp84 C-terminal domain-containing protein n=1 Tax=Sphingomonas jatrophae TaxID=1166337 RepID=A0A1I6L3E1_9SPHN|nr:DUF2163 domain-containing protein [Sphingomonas jatrophae]SFR97981.1 phage conserved hypothetical protein BR0599 [Sphingomonas jatrophae]
MSWLDPALTTIAFLWRLDRRDGVALGFTGHDHDLEISGLVYRASPGMMPSAIRRTDGMEADTLDVAGALTGEGMNEADLAAGRWDGARVTLSACDWSDPAAPPLLLARGELGAVGLEDARFTAELIGPSAILDRAVVEQTSPECRAVLGDARCRVDMAARVRIARVLDVDGTTVTLDTAEPVPNGWAYGRLRWIGGENSGLAAAILRSDGVTVTLREPPVFAVSPGKMVELREGCDGRFETCVARFANAANFRGEPHLPGNDLLTRYPGA